MDLNRQAMLVAASAILAPAAAGHVLRPKQLAQVIRRQATLPGVSRRPQLASAYATLLVAAEVLLTLGLVFTLFADTSTRAVGGLVLVSGLAFDTYIYALLRRDYRGDCGCSPLGAGLTRLSLVPGASLLVLGTVLVADPALDDVAFADTSGGLQTTLALGAAGLLGALLSMLPATALTGDPLTLRAEE